MKAVHVFYVCLILALSVLLVFTACRGQQDTALQTTEIGTVAKNGNDAEEQTTEAVEITTAVQTTEAPETTEAATPTETETAVGTSPLAAPTDTAQIVQLYNDAVNRAADGTASFTKTRKTDAESYQSSKILEKFKPRVFAFMGIDQQSTTRVTPQEENYDHYLQHASLTAADVDSAACTADGDGNYRIVLQIKSGESHVSKDGVTCTAPLDKSGIAVGERDKSYWDHKTAPNIYAALEGLAKGISVDEQYDSAVVQAVVQPDGTIVNINIRFHVAYSLTAIGGLYGNASGTTIITFDRFSVPKA